MSVTTKKHAGHDATVLCLLTPTYRIYLYPKTKTMRRVPLDHEGFHEDKLIFFEDEQYYDLSTHYWIDGRYDVVKAPSGTFRGELQ